MSRDALKKLDEQIMRGLRQAGLDDRLHWGSISVEGYFDIRYIEDGGGEDALLGEHPTFDCRAEDLPPIPQEDVVTVDGHGSFRYLRRQSNGVGRVLVVLGKVL